MNEHDLSPKQLGDIIARATTAWYQDRRRRNYLLDASPEVFQKLARLTPDEQKQTLDFCDRLFDVLDDARENLDRDEYREMLLDVIAVLQERQP